MDGFFQTFFSLLFNVLYIAILGRVLLSWVDPQGGMRVTQILRELTEPILGPLRRILPTIGFIDISPLVAFLILSVLRRLVMEM